MYVCMYKKNDRLQVVLLNSRISQKTRIVVVNLMVFDKIQTGARFRDIVVGMT